LQIAGQIRQKGKKHFVEQRVLGEFFGHIARLAHLLLYNLGD
jgi:hypothetical protein